jgi:hypothetical protein
VYQHRQASDGERVVSFGVVHFLKGSADPHGIHSSWIIS